MKYNTKSAWAEEIERVNQVRKQSPWDMARLMLWGIENLCHNKDDVIDLYDEVSEQLGMARKTLQNYASVARRFPAETVHAALEIGHHITVVAMPEEVAHYWLQRAEENAWSVQRLRQEIRAASQVPDEDEGDEGGGRDVVLRYLGNHGINATGDDKWLSMGFPDGKFVNLDSKSDLIWSVT